MTPPEPQPDGPEMDINIDTNIQEILLAASNHDIHKLRVLIRANETNDASNLGNPVNVRDPETGFTPLHAAIAACEDQGQDGDGAGAGVNGDGDAAEDGEEDKAVETVRFLLHEGAIWNDLDSNDETPGCIARRIGAKELYEMMVDAGVRAELLLNRLDGYEPLVEEEDDDDDDDDDDDESKETKGEEDDQAPNLVDTNATAATASESQPEPESVTIAEIPLPNQDQNQTDNQTENQNQNLDYLTSTLTFQTDRLLDQDKNGVMMAWETNLMQKSAQKLLPKPGLRVLNIGHGMGIIDDAFQNVHSSSPNASSTPSTSTSTSTPAASASASASDSDSGHSGPSAHHIIEAHPAVIEEMKRKGWHEKPGVVIHEGRWQDVLPKLVSEGVMFDAIFYDTFAEDYSDFRDFFAEHVIGLLEQGGRWGFFNGMGADRQISYDVYQKVVEMDLFESGFDVEWEEIKVPKLDGEWEGVRRPYWVVENYRLPVCTYMD